MTQRIWRLWIGQLCAPRRIAGAGCLLAILFLGACGQAAVGAASVPVAPTAAQPAAAPSPAPDAADGRQLTIDNFTFMPGTLTVSVDTTVTWTNHDDIPHTVTADDKSFGSAALDTDERFSHRFTAPGTYAYFCSIHPRMTGTIVVR